MSAATVSLTHTPFHQFHVDRGAKLIDFTGWDMPLHYGSIIEEHNQVRRSGGFFDVSHMGRFRITGRDVRAFLDLVCTRQIWGMSDGQVRYSMICNEQGGTKDDVLIYRYSETSYSMVCNASNRLKLLEHFDAVRGDMVFKLTDETESTAMIALQGPKVMEMLSSFSSEIPTLKRYRFIEKNLILARVMIARTGYTGEDGVEVILPAKIAARAVQLMQRMVDIDSSDSMIKPAGLGARDSLRLEAGMTLYGHEITEELDPVSAGLNFAIKLNKGEDPEKSPAEVGRFIGQDALQKIASEGPKRRLMGLILEGRRSARQGMKVFTTDGGSEIGLVTSGCSSPTLHKCIAMAYLDAAHCAPGNSVEIDLGRTRVSANVTMLPFYTSSG
ncbi:MAG: glycine cleavage system aminomethyltransferase GcvT [Planctomycetes bacterium]|nr:glycine cleavage system aminomethyltransferase GcvT [Planctomycetota bacterium]